MLRSNLDGIITSVREELQEILRVAYLLERKLNMLYAAMEESNGIGSEPDCFYARALINQKGDLQMLQEINLKYGNHDLDPNIIEKLGEGFVNLRAGHSAREDLLKQILEWETELVEVYKRSLRYLLSDDETRKTINRILTVKLDHRRELMGQLNMY